MAATNEGSGTGTLVLMSAASELSPSEAFLAEVIAHRKALKKVAELEPAARTGVKVRRPFEKANEDRHAAFQAKVAGWQAEAERKWLDPQHVGKPASAIANLIDSSCANTIRRHIKNPAGK